MNSSERKIIKNEIKEMNASALEELLMLGFSSFTSYIKCLLAYGIDSDITENNSKIFKYYIKDFKMQYRLTKGVLRNYKDIDYEAAYDVLDRLDYDMSESVDFYVRDINSYKETCKNKKNGIDEHWTAGVKKTITTPGATDNYKKEMVGLLLSLDDIKKELSYSKDFWDYIKDRIIELDYKDFENDKAAFKVVVEKNDAGVLKDVSVVIPKIVNLETALISVEILSRAYALYTNRFSIVHEDNEIYTYAAKSIKKDFVKRLNDIYERRV